MIVPMLKISTSRKEKASPSPRCCRRLRVHRISPVCDHGATEQARQKVEPAQQRASEQAFVQGDNGILRFSCSALTKGR